MSKLFIKSMVLAASLLAVQSTRTAAQPPSFREIGITFGTGCVLLGIHYMTKGHEDKSAIMSLALSGALAFTSYHMYRLIRRLENLGFFEIQQQAAAAPTWQPNNPTQTNEEKSGRRHRHRNDHT